jgi:tetratricopeptide (TPR) repeat protein
VIREALEIASQIGYCPAMCLLQSHLGISALEQGKYSQAHESFQQALMLSRRIEHHEYLVGALANLGQLARKQGNHALAESYLQEGLAIVRVMDNPFFLRIAGSGGVRTSFIKQRNTYVLQKWVFLYTIAE